MRLLKSTWRYLILAGAIHVALTTAIFLIGHFRVLPNTFNEDGIGITFAIDGRTYNQVAIGLVGQWKTNGFITWLNTKAPLHSRLHSVSFMLFGWLLGYNILGAEPLNLFYYLAILSCIYFLGRELFDAETGLLAAAIIAVWPTFLLHSTQLIRDPLSNACLLALMLVLTTVISRQFTPRNAILIGVGGAGLVTLFWLARGNMWNVVILAVAITLAMLAGRMICARRFMTGNVIVMLLTITALIVVPSRLESTTLPGVRPPNATLTLSSTIKQMSGRRAGFRSYTSQASNIDTDVQFNSTGDVVRYLPRAFEIGFFAPFPRMWIEVGSFGRAPRLLSGLETLAMYFVYVVAGLCVWRERRNLKMWLVFLVATIGILALGFVVANAGALFRIRYVFWMMLIVLAAKEINRSYKSYRTYLTVRRTNSTKSLTSSSVVSNDAIKRTSEISSFQT